MMRLCLKWILIFGLAITAAYAIPYAVGVEVQGWHDVKGSALSDALEKMGHGKRR